MSRARLIVFGAFVLVPSAAWTQGPVGPEFRVNTYTGADQQRAALAADAAGNFVVVWASPGDGFGPGIFGQRFSAAGVPMGSEFRVNTYTTNTQTYPAVASDAAGNFVVVWASDEQDGQGHDVFGQRYDASGSPLGPEFRVNTYTSLYQSFPSVASDSSGNFVVVWSDGPAGLLDIVGQRFASSGSPLDAAFRISTYAGQFFPDVARDPVGNFVVVWRSLAYQDIFARRYASSGAPLAPEFHFNTSGYPTYPDVAADAAGNFVVVWNTSDAFGQEIGDVLGQRFSNNGAPLGPKFQVATSPYLQYNASVASDAAGNFVVAWESQNQDGSSRGVFGQRYASDGAPLGTEFRVNTHTSNSQDSPAVAADPAGTFVVVWESQNQDGLGNGVFGQRYRPIVSVELLRFGVE